MAKNEPDPAEVRALAHQRLAEAIAQAEAGRLFGLVAVEVSFRAGRATMVRRTVEATERPA